MPPKLVLLSVVMTMILAAVVANELHPRALNAAMDEDKMEGKLADIHWSRGPSGLVDYTGFNHNSVPNPAPTQAPSVAETADGYNQVGGMCSNQNGCGCKHKHKPPPTEDPAKAPAKF
ncbi:hypothetical protein MLD38_010223 [Melastoma candidum]|uniref:Uncharacterized protein n=1 Tax=Melastoma candidum TaxID=119954 RepID=A0ACB9R2P4_9MYRT|nr:hypothetical protein MLD38_010223 [Melastoma candidum]